MNSVTDWCLSTKGVHLLLPVCSGILRIRIVSSLEDSGMLLSLPSLPMDILIPAPWSVPLIWL